MNKFSMTIISLVTMTSFALAQQKTDPKTGSAGGATATGAGATVKAGAGATGAKAGVGVQAGATGSAAAPAPSMAMPKPPEDIKTALKAMGTRSNCTGVTWGGPEGKTEVKMKSTGTNALALDGWWIKGSMTATMGEGKAKGTLKIDSYMTWDAKAGTWRQVGMANDGSVMIGTATMKDGKFEATSDTFGGMMGNGKFRDRGDMTDPKNMKMTGEFSADGKTWTKVYELTCKK